MLACAALSACGGSGPSPDQLHRERLSASIDASYRVTCRAEACDVAWSYPFHSRLEASFLALPPVVEVDGDPSLAPIKTLTVAIHNGAATSTAHFTCRMPTHRPTGSGSYTVTLVRHLCAISVAHA